MTFFKILKFPDFSLTLNFPDFTLTTGKPTVEINWSLTFFTCIHNTINYVTFANNSSEIRYGLGLNLNEKGETQGC